MKRKLTLALLVLVASIALSVPASADGQNCGTTSYPSAVCSAPAPPAPTPSPSLEDIVLAVLAFIF
jgi:hypothetical protein